mgnify:CR=1 FL=1
MANPLLDFVMSVVRDPDVAAHYAADPAGAIAAANLTGVTTADVAHLIPVVSESLGAVSSATGGVPTAGFDDPGVNVWTSGAATAAFDAFDAFNTHVPTVVSPQVISDPDLGGLGNAPDLPIHTAVPDLAVAAPDLAPPMLIFENPRSSPLGPAIRVMTMFAQKRVPSLRRRNPSSSNRPSRAATSSASAPKGWTGRCSRAAARRRC